MQREVFLKCENPIQLKQTIDIIKKEIDELEGNRSPVQVSAYYLIDKLKNALRAVTARENCLRHLRDLTNKLQTDHDESSNQFDNEQFIEKASELLTHLRILSLNVVESILRWRDYIQQIYYISRGVVKTNQAIMIPFLLDETNYLIKVIVTKYL